MPELPEVETIKESLKQKIVFKKIQDAEILCPKLIKFPEPAGFIKSIKNKKIKSLERRGKYLIAKLSSHYNLIIHLGMTGQLIYINSDSHPVVDKHTHLFFNFDDKAQLQYNDVRKFGAIWLVKDGSLRFVPGLSQLGPEPLSEDFSLEYFQELLNKKSIIKYVLLNQKNLAGLGNIYVDEILFRAGIYPERNAQDLSLSERKKLYHAIREVLREAIKARGTSVVNYIDGEGRKGDFQKYLKVYKRVGRPCYKCKTLIKRMVLAGRGTYFCPKCQV
ncbi:MAG: formamidopyrimidine-DNA glycosylase [Firmicutes bacterium HGW-Firmicutes-13]|nr:MAG: formamidopyrimidine-DNA glycosylase [Firmicutes bacterium HGW-Firmicutes-13]